ncbi:MAG: sensor domain-containing diguanylate cyclase [Terracidiphilus sp.]|nr:sensor domain-containing diguanylate cyclase [Terracidiphilus sp.]
MTPEDEKKTALPTDPAFYKDLLDHMSDGVYFVDRDRRILYWNEGAQRLTGYKAEEMMGRQCQDDLLCHVDGAGRRLCQEGCPLSASVEDGAPHEASVFLRHKLGRRVPVNVRVQPMRDAKGDIIGAIEIFNDDSAQHAVRRRAEALQRIAFLDHLTQLPNRRFLEMTVRTVLSEFEVHKDASGVLLIDLDGFKNINDSYGHACGDLALQEVAKTLTGVLRPTDILGRWGGDEFMAIVRSVNFENLRALAQRCVAIVAATSIPRSDGSRIGLSISVGAALLRMGESAEEIISRADLLMYRSKTNGRGCATME